MKVQIFLLLLCHSFVTDSKRIPSFDRDEPDSEDRFSKEAKVANHRTYMAKVLKKNQPFLRPAVFDTVVIVPKEPIKIAARAPTTTTHAPTTKTTTTMVTTTTHAPTPSPEEVKEKEFKYHHRLNELAFKILNESMKTAIEQAKEYYCGWKVGVKYYYRKEDDYNIVEFWRDDFLRKVRSACQENLKGGHKNNIDRSNLPHQFFQMRIDGDVIFQLFGRDKIHLADKKESCPKHNSEEEKKLVNDVKERLVQLIAVKEFKDSFKVEAFRTDPWTGITFNKETVSAHVSMRCNKVMKIIRKYPPLALLLGYIAFISILIL